jgi:excisionase family DNA binding protein
MESTIFTAQELADYLHVKPVTVYKMAKQGRVPAFRVAKSWRFHKPTIDEWLTERSRYTSRTKDRV